MLKSVRILYDGDINGSYLTILLVNESDAIYLYDEYKPDFICEDITSGTHKLFFYNRKIEFEKQKHASYYEIIKFSDIINSKSKINCEDKIILLDIENGKDITLDNSDSVNGYLFNKSMIIALKGYNEYSSLTFSSNILRSTLFYGLPSSMRIYIDGCSNDDSTFINSECTLIKNKDIETYRTVKVNGIKTIEKYDINDPLDSIRNFNEKRGLIEQGFDLRRELNFIVEEVVEATNINIDSDKAKEKAKAIVDELLKDCVTTNENSMDAFIDIIVFAVGALYKLAPKMNIDVKEEIMKVIRNIEFKPYLKDENGKVIKDPDYKKYREK